jgi:hypothetical protein
MKNWSDYYFMTVGDAYHENISRLSFISTEIKTPATGLSKERAAALLGHPGLASKFIWLQQNKNPAVRVRI